MLLNRTNHFPLSAILRFRRITRSPGDVFVALLFFVLTALLPLTAAAAPLAKVQSTGLAIALQSSGGGSYSLSIYPLPGKVTGTVQADVMVIENPIRLVIDVPGVPSKSASSEPVKDGKVTAVRVGVHSDKTRIVVDIAGTEKPEYEVRDAGTVLFSFGGASLANEPEDSEPITDPEPREEPAVTPTPEARPTPEATGTPRGTPTAKATPTPRYEATAVETPEPTALEPVGKAATPDEPEEIDPDIPAISNQPGTSVVKAIYYQTMNNTTVPAVVFDTEGLDTYSLNKKKADQYELVIQNAHLGGKHLLLPQFPPDSFKGFSVIVATEEGGNVFVKIYVEENVKLFPFTAKGQLWLKVAE